ncbi:hypothetical protein Dimus_029065 [Dionaea muscipula]
MGLMATTSATTGGGARQTAAVGEGLSIVLPLLVAASDATGTRHLPGIIGGRISVVGKWVSSPVMGIGDLDGFRLCLSSVACFYDDGVGGIGMAYRWVPLLWGCSCSYMGLVVVMSHGLHGLVVWVNLWLSHCAGGSW